METTETGADNDSLSPLAFITDAALRRLHSEIAWQFKEEISDSCKNLFSRFVNAVRDDPSLIQNVTVNLRDGLTVTASADLSTLQIATVIAPLVRLNIGSLADATNVGTGGYTLYNLIAIDPDHYGTTLLFHELYHAGQFYSDPENASSLFWEQFDDDYGPLERQAYAASEAFRGWLNKQDEGCTRK